LRAGFGAGESAIDIDVDAFHDRRDFSPAYPLLIGRPDSGRLF
jgi:hypothetical protein